MRQVHFLRHSDPPPRKRQRRIRVTVVVQNEIASGLEEAADRLQR